MSRKSGWRRQGRQQQTISRLNPNQAPAGVLYVWQEKAADGRWGVITAYANAMLGHAPLMSRDLSIATGFLRDIAKQHAERTGQPVRLAVFHFTKTLETIT